MPFMSNMLKANANWLDYIVCGWNCLDERHWSTPGDCIVLGDETWKLWFRHNHKMNPNQVQRRRRHQPPQQLLLEQQWQPPLLVLPPSSQMNPVSKSAKNVAHRSLKSFFAVSNAFKPHPDVSLSFSLSPLFFILPSFRSNIQLKDFV